MENVLRLSPAVRDTVVDLDAIEALESALGPDLCVEVVEDGILQAADRLIVIERAMEAEEWRAVVRAARELAAITARIGLAPIASQAESLEECCLSLDRIAAHAVAARLLRTGEAAICSSQAPAVR